MESGFKNIRIRCRIRRMRGDEAVSRKKKLRVQKYPGTCGRGLGPIYIVSGTRDNPPLELPLPR